MKVESIKLFKYRNEEISVQVTGKYRVSPFVSQHIPSTYLHGITDLRGTLTDSESISNLFYLECISSYRPTQLRTDCYPLSVPSRFTCTLLTIIIDQVEYYINVYRLSEDMTPIL